MFTLKSAVILGLEASREPEEIFREYGLIWDTKSKETLRWVLPKSKKTQKLKTCSNPWISSAMAMAMSIYRTLCVLVFLKISLLEMLIAFGNGLPLTFSNLMVTTYDSPLTSN